MYIIFAITQVLPLVPGQAKFRPGSNTILKTVSEVKKEAWRNISHFKALFIFHNDAHNYKITGILKQLKF
jgi:hypothetical protein